MRLFRCDRCLTDGPTMTGWKMVSLAEPPAVQPAPNAGGGMIMGVAHGYPYSPAGKEICAKCVSDLATWLQPLPQAG